MMKKTMLMLAALLSVAQLYAQIPQTYLIDPQRIAAKKADYRQGKPEVVKQVQVVIKAADKMLDATPASVMAKAFTPPSGTKHDYMSLAPYFWPDPAKADGLPYIRKDGQRNPEIKKISDHELQSEMESRCKYLALAYYFTDDEKYATKANQLMQVWFLDADTRMNPNLNYAQAIRGVNDGRGIGLIETRCLASLVDWIGLIDGAKSFPKQNYEGIKDWYKQFLNWMQTSKNGKDEHNSKNNHGTYYDVQLVTYALFTGNDALARQVLTQSKERIALQIDPDGKQPLELERTNACGYSTMNLNGWFDMASLGDRAGIDLWNYTAPGRGSIRKSVDWLLPYALGEKAFPYQQINPYNKEDFYRILIQSGLKYQSDVYVQKAQAIPRSNGTYVDDLLFN